MTSARQLARETWHELEHRIRKADRRLITKLPGPATPAALDRYEQLLGVPLPPLVHELYSVHDGIGMPAYVSVGEYKYGASSYFLCLNDSIDAWSLLTDGLRSGMFDDFVVEETSGGVKANWWNALWIPVTADGAGNCHCVDLDPTGEGSVGQVIDFWHDDTDRNVRAPSLAEFLLMYVEEDEWAASFDLATRTN